MDPAGQLAAQRILEWYVSHGVTEALEPAPRNRLAAPVVAEAVPVRSPIPAEIKGSAAAKTEAERHHRRRDLEQQHDGEEGQRRAQHQIEVQRAMPRRQRLRRHQRQGDQQ